MLAQLLRPGTWRHSRHPSQESGVSPRASSQGRRWSRFRSEQCRDEEDDDDEDGTYEDADEDEDDYEEEDVHEEDEDNVEEPLLPIFSAELLGMNLLRPFFLLTGYRGYNTD